jgi:MtfA peptidase
MCWTAERSARERWLQTLGDEYEAFCADVDAGMDTLLDPYAAEAIDEFFAVSAEVFFVAPDELQQAHPQVYELLMRFFQQDPAHDARSA